MKLAISSDSTLSITQAEAKELGIHVLPLNVIVDGKEYHDDIDIAKDELAAFMRAGSRISTSTPTPVEIETYFDELFAQGYDKVIHFTISSKLSSMFDLFTVTCKNLYEDKVIVIDSLSLCSFMANHVLSALKYRYEGLELEPIVARIKARIATESVIFIPESSTFLKNGGRVSPAVAAIGNLFGLKPILTFENGEIGKKGATRKIKQAIEDELVEFKKRGYAADKFSVDIVQFDTSSTNMEIMYHFLERHFPGYDIHLRPLSINVCAHTGPGTVGFGFNLKIGAEI